MSFRKSSLQEFQHQYKDMRSQLFEQIKCLEQRTTDQVAIYQEVNDFMKKRAELDLQYSKELDKLVKSVMLKHKNERQRRTNWSLYSICNLWQQIVDDAKEEAKQRSISAEIYANNIVPAIANKCTTMQKISKKCREIGLLAQGEVVRVINELSLAMKTYQHCYAQFSVLGTKLQQADDQKKKTMDTNSSTRKQRSVQKTYEKKSEKYEVARQKCTRSRNEYLLCIDAANASVHKYFADDVSDIVDCSDLGMDWWLGLVLQNIISARKSACQTEMNALANLSSFKDSLQSHADKQRFFENNHQTFMLPQRFHFKCEPSESISKILTENLVEEFKQRNHQIRKRLNTLRSESEIGWKSMEEMEKQIRDLLTASTLVEINEFGIADNRPPLEGLEIEMAKLYEQYLQTSSFFLLNANLITRLEARADGIGESLKGIREEEILLTPKRQNMATGMEGALKTVKEEGMGAQEDGQSEQQMAMQRRKRRIGSQASTEQQPSSWAARPRLFGGSLDEYTETTSEPIPLIVISCIRVLSQFALQHQGIFRISGSQIEINRMREAFESGEDPLKEVKDASDANSIAGLLKLYLRELREPLFPFYLFDLLTDCAKCSSIADFMSKISPLLNKLPRPSYLLLRYLFAFLNHLSEFSDENMMDPYNLAICFGPTLLPIPEGKDQVIHQNSVNEVIKNLIVHYDGVFVQRVSGPRYEKYNFSSLGTPADTELELFMDDEAMEEPAAMEEGNNGTATRGEYHQQESIGPRAAHHRLPFLANYTPPSEQISRQSLMQFSTCSANSTTTNEYPDQNYFIGGRQMGGRSADIPGPNEMQQIDFSNNYSSAESGIDGALMTKKISGLRLISPSQKRPVETSAIYHQQWPPMVNSQGEGGNSQGGIYKKNYPDNPADLYASIKRNERIRIPVSPKQACKTEKIGDVEIPDSILTQSYPPSLPAATSEIRPPSYHSLFETPSNIRANLLMSGRREDGSNEEGKEELAQIENNCFRILPGVGGAAAERSQNSGGGIMGKTEKEGGSVKEGEKESSAAAYKPIRTIDDLLDKLSPIGTNHNNNRTTDS